VGFMVDKVLLGSLFLQVLWFSLLSFQQHSIVVFHLSDISDIQSWQLTASLIEHFSVAVFISLYSVISQRTVMFDENTCHYL
jgi:hypothetical protein